jgi:hypothetical protein
MNYSKTVLQRLSLMPRTRPRQPHQPASQRLRTTIADNKLATLFRRSGLSDELMRYLWFSSSKDQSLAFSACSLGGGTAKRLQSLCPLCRVESENLEAL